MKPLHLTMEAFGPYATSTSIDFRPLHGKPLVLIHGPTGGGKTAILDAMCFALFGKTSGDEREGSDLRSDLAAKDMLTRVTFDFVQGSQTFRIRREPKQLKKKARGDGVTDHQPQAWLWDLNEDGSEGLLLAEKPSAVTPKIKSILGFDEKQFRQIVVLPQGKFRDFLSAKAKEKQEILETLFGTAIYERITDALKQEADELEQRYRESRQSQTLHLSSVGHETKADLLTEIETRTTQLPKLTEESEGLKQRRDAGATKLEQAREIQNKYQAQVTAANDVTHLEGQIKPYAAKEERLKLLQKVQPLAHERDELEHLKAQTKQAETTLSDLKSKAQTTSQKLLEAQTQRKAEEHEDAAQLRKEAQEHLNMLNALVDASQEYEAISNTETRLATTLASAKEAESKASDHLKRCKEKLIKVQEEASQLATLRVKHLEAQEALKQHKALKEPLVQRDQATAHIQAVDAQLTAGQRDVEQSERSLREAETASKTLRITWHKAQAAILAQQLESSKPCPVCGSTNHPSPASSTEQLPSETDLQDADDVIGTKRTHLEKAQTELQDARARKEQHLAQVETYNQQLGNASQLTVEMHHTRTEELNTVLEEAKVLLDTCISADASYKRGRDMMPGIEAKTQESIQARQDAELEHEGAKARLESLRERLPEDLRDPNVFKTRRTDAQQRHTHLQGRLDNARDKAVEAEKASLQANADLEHASQRLNELQEQSRQKQTSLQDKLKNAGLHDNELFRKALEELPTQESLERSIQTFKEDLNQARGRLEAATAALGDAKPQDLETLVARATELNDVYNAKEQERLQSETRLTTLKETLKTVEELETSCGEDSDRYEAMAELATAASGKNARRLSLQRYVLASLLDDVLAHASERLRIMSTGRYRVLRDDNVRDARQAGGLDLLVEDQYTGESRPIATLSGGESFQAALALSLGLADVIQALSGGIRVDALFIDEGFGTLDGEALERAISELLKLRDGGRLVGIISHVRELRHRVSARIEVTKGQRGSSIEVHAGD